MSGHSKWASIKRAKGAADAARGKVFGKLSRLITVAAREGGMDPDMNPSLRLAVDRAKDANMPSANIERAIQKGGGVLEGQEMSDLLLEALGPGQSGLLISAVTDNSNRTIADVKHILTKSGNTFAGQNSVKWMFKRVGRIVVEGVGVDQVDEVSLQAIDAGAEDVVVERIDDALNNLVVLTSPIELNAVLGGLEGADLKIGDSELTYIAEQPRELSEVELEQLNALIDQIEEHDDVVGVVTNVSNLSR